MMKIKIKVSHVDGDRAWDINHTYEVSVKTGQKKLKDGLAERVDSHWLAAQYLAKAGVSVTGTLPKDFAKSCKELGVEVAGE